MWKPKFMMNTNVKAGMGKGAELAAMAITFNVVVGGAFWLNSIVQNWLMRRRFKKMQESMAANMPKELTVPILVEEVNEEVANAE